MHPKRRVGESDDQLAQRVHRLVATMRHREQVGDGQMADAIGGIDGRADGRGIGRPHRRCRQRLRLQVRRGGGVIGCERAEPKMVGAGVRQQDSLRQPERDVAAHLGDALQGGGARVADRACVLGCRQIAATEPGVIVAGPDQPVEIDLDQPGRVARHNRAV